MTLEAEAVSLWHFGVSTVHGLLQTEAYARELLVLGGYEGAKLEQQVTARAGRRMVLEGEGAQALGLAPDSGARRGWLCGQAVDQQQPANLLVWGQAVRSFTVCILCVM